MAEKRKKCKVCNHKLVAEIDQKISGTSSISSLSTIYGLARATLTKHKNICLAAVTTSDAAKELVYNADSPILKAIQAELERIHKLVNACDDYLIDPEDPAKYYVGPRAHDVDIVYMEYDKEKKRTSRTRRKANMQEILHRIDSDGEYVIQNITSKFSDPRDLLLKAITKLEATTKLIIESNQKAIEWEHKNRALAKLSKSGSAEISVERELQILTEKITIAYKDSNSEELCDLAGLEIKD